MHSTVRVIEPEEVQEPLENLLGEAEEQLRKIASSREAAQWETVIEPLTNATERLGRLWSAIHHLGRRYGQPRMA